jgi:hypothetical protein
MLVKDLHIATGDDWAFLAEVRTAAGAVRPVPGWTFDFTVTRQPDSPAGAAVLRRVVRDSAGAWQGQAFQSVPAGEMPPAGSYHWRLRVRTAEGFITTAGRGAFLVGSDSDEATAFNITAGAVPLEVTLLVPERGPAGPMNTNPAALSGTDWISRIVNGVTEYSWDGGTKWFRHQPVLMGSTPEFQWVEL